MATGEDVEVKFGASLTPHQRREALKRRTGARNPLSRSPHRLTSATARFPGLQPIFCVPYTKQRRGRQSISEHYAGRESETKPPPRRCLT
jgi:hypothetical protein